MNRSKNHKLLKQMKLNYKSCNKKLIYFDKSPHKNPTKIIPNKITILINKNQINILMIASMSHKRGVENYYSISFQGWWWWWWLTATKKIIWNTLLLMWVVVLISNVCNPYFERHNSWFRYIPYNLHRYMFYFFCI